MDRLDFAFDDNIATASTLPARLYVDPQVLAPEKRRIFAKTWQLAGRSDQVPGPGAYFTVDVAGEPIVVVRGKDDRLRAFHNVCRHRAGPVAEGAG